MRRARTSGASPARAERKRVLLDHIFGVDIDPQAVEVTKLSLLLKVLEGESHESLQKQLKLFHERALPDLSSNIKCGNSLIGADYHTQTSLRDVDLDRLLQANTFDWESEFREVMCSGGFDVVVGNPPYIFTREQLTAEERTYYAEHYELGWEKQNTYMLFMEKLLYLLAADGKGGLIVPNSWLTIESAKLLRPPMIERLNLIADLNYAAFERVSMEPSIFVVSGEKQRGSVVALRSASIREFLAGECSYVDRSQWQVGEGRIVYSASSGAMELANTLAESCGSTVGSNFDVRAGMQAYERGKGVPPQTAEDVKEHVFDREEQEDADSFRYLQGKDVGRYCLDWSGMWMQYGPWLAQPRELPMFSRPRVLVREITGALPYVFHACLVKDGVFLNNKSVLNILHESDDTRALSALVCVLNSRLMSFYYKQKAVKSNRKIFPKVVIRNMREFPFPASLTSQSLDEAKSLCSERELIERAARRAKDGHERSALARRARQLDERIDAFACSIYGLSTEDEAIVTAATSDEAK